MKIDDARFHRVYANLPLVERDVPIVVINDEPISWRVARLEIEGRTKMGKKILGQLAKLGFI